MITVKELISAGEDKTIQFGDYSLDAKNKKDGFEFFGDIYKVKTFKDITKLEKNEMFAFESVPGSAVTGYAATNEQITFEAYGEGDVQFTLGVEPETSYEVYVNGESIGEVSTNVSGKLSISAELDTDRATKVKVVKIA